MPERWIRSSGLTGGTRTRDIMLGGLCPWWCVGVALGMETATWPADGEAAVWMPLVVGGVGMADGYEKWGRVDVGKGGRDSDMLSRLR